MSQPARTHDELFRPMTVAERASHHETLLDEALTHNSGNRAWREWKALAARDVLDLVNQTERVRVLAVGLDGDFNMNYAVRMPVPRWPTGDKLFIDSAAVFHLHYQETWRSESPPGWAPLGLWHPLDAFHPNMRPALRGAICLGTLPPGIAPKEILLLGYYALSLQNCVLDETDPHGILNASACEFYRCHPEYRPLTTAGLLDPWEGVN